MQTLKMSRDTRKVFQALETFGLKQGWQVEIIPASIFLCDKKIIRYNTPPLLNALNTRLSLVSKPEPKHATFDYWDPVLENLLKRGATKRNMNIQELELKQLEPMKAFEYLISEYLITDYSIDDAMNLQNIVRTYSLLDISTACKIATKNNVYSISYIMAILISNNAKKEIEEQKITDLGVKIELSSKKLNVEIHEHSPLDLAMAEYKWETKRKNAELERKINEL